MEDSKEENPGEKYHISGETVDKEVEIYGSNYPRVSEKLIEARLVLYDELITGDNLLKRHLTDSEILKKLTGIDVPDENQAQYLLNQLEMAAFAHSIQQAEKAIRPIDERLHSMKMARSKKGKEVDKNQFEEGVDLMIKGMKHKQAIEGNKKLFRLSLLLRDTLGVKIGKRKIMEGLNEKLNMTLKENIRQINSNIVLIAHSRKQTRY